MIINFSIKFSTKWGENLFITGSTAELGDNRLEDAFGLEYSEGGIWKGSINCEAAKNRVVSYRYFVKNEKGDIYFEVGATRSLALSANTKSIYTMDQWQGYTEEAPFFTAPFSEVFFANNNIQHTQFHKYTKEIIIRATIANVPADDKIILCGTSKQTGKWDPSAGIEMHRMKGLRWEAYIDAEKHEGTVLEYKFVKKSTKAKTYIWEEGANRKLILPKVHKNSSIIYEHSFVNIPSSMPKFAGTQVPVFALKTKKSWGIGDFGDLKFLIDWAKETRQSILQLLPINDTSVTKTWHDSYPYNCLSTIALNPIYMNMESLGKLNDKSLQKKFENEGKAMNRMVFTDYEDVYNLKTRYCREIYAQDKEKTFAEPDFYIFIKENKDWIYSYALFCSIRDDLGTSDCRKWGRLSTFSEKIVLSLISEKSKYHNSVFFYIYLQYNLHKQMCSAKKYAHENGVALKGDIPIGISRNSVEAWQYPELFNFSQQAGAPPDAFSQTGQIWGFPTYNWDEMAKDNYKWWKKRLAHLSQYFDAYRIDHILGFFRIWEVPVEFKSGLMGHFCPAFPLSEQEIKEWGLPLDTALFKRTKEGIADGLFIKDPYQPEKYHPMIGAKSYREYNNLPDWQKKRFDDLSNYYFYKRHNDMWYNNAMKKLQQLIASTNMLTCGEDLGMLNPSVHACMANLKILSLELQIMPKETGRKLGDPASYPYLSVCTTSTHDSETLRMWLGKLLGTDMGELESFENGKSVVLKDASPEECKKVLIQNLNSPSMLAIFPIQDWLSINDRLRNKHVNSERINYPDDPDNYWRYRLHINLEDMIAAKSFNNEIADMVNGSGRNKETEN